MFLRSAAPPELAPLCLRAPIHPFMRRSGRGILSRDQHGDDQLLKESFRRHVKRISGKPRRHLRHDQGSRLSSGRRRIHCWLQGHSNRLNRRLRHRSGSKTGDPHIQDDESGLHSREKSFFYCFEPSMRPCAAGGLPFGKQFFLKCRYGGQYLFVNEDYTWDNPYGPCQRQSPSLDHGSFAETFAGTLVFF